MRTQGWGVGGVVGNIESCRFELKPLSLLLGGTTWPSPLLFQVLLSLFLRFTARSFSSTALFFTVRCLSLPRQKKVQTSWLSPWVLLALSFVLYLSHSDESGRQRLPRPFLRSLRPPYTESWSTDQWTYMSSDWPLPYSKCL